ncbi:MAG TPA: VWA domain-containing protein [Kofleriaceae bacterium]|jgi:Ca-activated chloride channel family protein
MQLAHRARTSAVIATAGGTIVAALLLTGRVAPTKTAVLEQTGATCSIVKNDGMAIGAELMTAKILAGASLQNVAVTVYAPRLLDHAQRPPLSVAIVIDRSGSMHGLDGSPLENAKAAASRLIGQLGPNDSFSVVAYSTGDQVVMPMSRATDDNKSRARDAITSLYADGGTCISCGLSTGEGELAHAGLEGVRRIVLISDGQANEGIRDRDQLAHFTADIANHGVSVSAVGVGLDFDEVTMQRIADVGHGNYYFVEDTAVLGEMFAKELSGLSSTVASNVTLTLTPTAGVTLDDAYGYATTRNPDGTLSLSLADLRDGEQRKVVVRTRVAKQELGAAVIANAKLDYRPINSQFFDDVTACVGATVVDDARAVADSVNPRAAAAIEEALSAQALEEAVKVNETQGADAAQVVLDRRMDEVRANTAVSPQVKAKIEAYTTSAGDNFKHAAPAKSAKASRAAAYELSR